MAFNDKISKALASALYHADKSISALKSGDEKAFSNDLWHVAAELEYALFLFSLTLKNERNVQMPKPNPNPKDLQTDHIMLKVKELIEEAQNLLKSGDLPNAHKNAYQARHYIFKLQENMGKEKRGARRKDKAD